MSNLVEEFRHAKGGLEQPSEDLLQLANTMRIHSRPFIGGRFVEPHTQETFENLSPINGEIINRMPRCDKPDVDRAVRAGSAVFEEGSWSRCAPANRKTVMLRFADLIETHADELAILDAVDVGKPYEVTKTVDLTSALRTIRWYAESTDKVYGEVAPTPTTDFIIREPLGVVAAITPWNYPLMIASWKFAPMLAAGNSVVLKPAEQSPLSALRLAELSAEAGFPDGVFNVIPGLGPEAGAALGLHSSIRAIGFTGSTTVGKKFFEYASRSTIKSISLECGGKSPAIVCEDVDIKTAAAGIASGLFYNAGQNCNGPTRIIVHKSQEKNLIDALIGEARSYYPNNPLHRGSRVGAVVSSEQLEHIEQLVHAGKEDGAQVVLGGHRLYPESGGYYYEPTVFTYTNASMRINQEEIFGPVVPVQTFETLEEALQIANATSYGLWASVWTNNLPSALFFANRIAAGTVAINNAFGGDVTTPLGGFRESGTGRDRSLHALHKYTQLKHIHLNFPK